MTSPEVIEIEEVIRRAGPVTIPSEARLYDLCTIRCLNVYSSFTSEQGLPSVVTGVKGGPVATCVPADILEDMAAIVAPGAAKKACEEGNLRRLHVIYSIGVTPIAGIGRSTVERCCASVGMAAGHRPIVEYLSARSICPTTAGVLTAVRQGHLSTLVTPATRIGAALSSGNTDVLNEMVGGESSLRRTIITAMRDESSMYRRFYADPLINMVRHGHLSVLRWIFRNFPEWLLSADNGFKIDLLFCACSRDNLEMVNLLTESDMNVAIDDLFGSGMQTVDVFKAVLRITGTTVDGAVANDVATQGGVELVKYCRSLGAVPTTMHLRYFARFNTDAAKLALEIASTDPTETGLGMAYTRDTLTYLFDHSVYGPRVRDVISRAGGLTGSAATRERQITEAFIEIRQVVENVLRTRPMVDLEDGLDAILTLGEWIYPVMVEYYDCDRYTAAYLLFSYDDFAKAVTHGKTSIVRYLLDVEMRISTVRPPELPAREVAEDSAVVRERRMPLAGFTIGCHESASRENIVDIAISAGDYPDMIEVLLKAGLYPTQSGVVDAIMRGRSPTIIQLLYTNARESPIPLAPTFDPRGRYSYPSHYGVRSINLDGTMQLLSQWGWEVLVYPTVYGDHREIPHDDILHPCRYEVL